MRLLVVTNDYPPRPGGIQQYLANVIDAYPHDVLVLAPADSRAQPDPMVARGKWRFMWPTPGVRRWVHDQAGQFQPDAVFFGAPYPLPWLGPGLRDRFNIPYGVLSHGAEITLPAAFPVSRQLLARPLKKADALFSNGRFTAGVVGRLTKKPVQVLGGGVDFQAFWPPDVPPRNEPAVIGCVSRFVPRKGQHRLLRAVAELQANGTVVELLLVGRGRKEGALRRLSNRLGVATRFEVDVGWERLGDLYRQMDIFCMPCRSRWFGLEPEGLGLVFLEAAACGVPVLAGSSGGAPETVEPGKTGFVVHDEADIVEAVELMLGDRDRAMAMGEAGRKRIESQFTWALSAERLEAGFAAVV